MFCGPVANRRHDTCLAQLSLPTVLNIGKWIQQLRMRRPSSVYAWFSRFSGSLTVVYRGGSIASVRHLFIYLYLSPGVAVCLWVERIQELRSSHRQNTHLAQVYLFVSATERCLLTPVLTDVVQLCAVHTTPPRRRTYARRRYARVRCYRIS